MGGCRTSLITACTMPSPVPSCLQWYEQPSRAITTNPPAWKQVVRPHIIGNRCGHWWQPASLFQAALVVSRWRCVDCCGLAPVPTTHQRRLGRWPPLRRGWLQDGVHSDGSSLPYRPADWCSLAYIMHSGISNRSIRSVQQQVDF